MAVLALLMVRAWRDVAWMIALGAAVKAASRLSPEARRRASTRLDDGGMFASACDLVVKVIADGTHLDGHEGVVAVRDGLRRRSYMLRGIARLGSVTTMLSIVIELSWGLGGGSGIEALQAGLPERLAIGRATTSLSIGAATVILYVWLARKLHSRMEGVLGALRTLMARLAETR